MTTKKRPTRSQVKFEREGWERVSDSYYKRNIWLGDVRLISIRIEINAQGFWVPLLGLTPVKNGAHKNPQVAAETAEIFAAFKLREAAASLTIR